MIHAFIRGSFYVALVTMLVAGCASKETAAEKKSEANAKVARAESMAVRSAAAENEASFVTEISFSRGATELSAAQKQKLAAFIGDAKKNGKIDDIKVVTWADMEYPSVNTKKLSKEQRDLAKRRNDQVEKYLESIASGVDVDAFNMAERPNALQRLLNTSDARVKRSLEVAGIPTTDSAVKVPAKSSKSIVMLVME